MLRTVKLSVAETVPDKASFHTRNATAERFLLWSRNISQCKCNTCNATEHFSCSHCTGSVFATLYFTIWYSVKTALMRASQTTIYENIIKIRCKKPLNSLKLAFGSCFRFVLFASTCNSLAVYTKNRMFTSSRTCTRIVCSKNVHLKNNDSKNNNDVIS